MKRSTGGLAYLALLAGLATAATGCPPASNGGAGGAQVGREIYVDQRCGKCHKVGGKGGIMGPALDDPKAPARTREWVREYLKDPMSKVDDARMPAVLVEGEELEALLDYLAKLNP
ncbi:MAG: c-type cytochrome [Planctomycetota bacterium]|nr:c-type cytochrome [Planctomycetota bacterium]